MSLPRTAPPSAEQVTQALGGVQDPEIHRPITELGMVKNVEVGDGPVDLRVLHAAELVTQALGGAVRERDMAPCYLGPVRAIIPNGPGSTPADT